MCDTKRQTTIVTAADANYAWGVMLLLSSLRQNGMTHPAVVGAVQWPETWKERLSRLPGVTRVDFPGDRRSVTCLKPATMLAEAVQTPWVTWADSDGLFIGNCDDLLLPSQENEILIRPYDPPPTDLTADTLATWQRDVGERTEPRHRTRFNGAFMTIHRSFAGFLDHWRSQMAKVLPQDVGIIMAHGSPYFQTDESVLASLLSFADTAPQIAAPYTMDGRTVNRTRYFAHFAYNPKPWQMWNSHCLRWKENIFQTVDWMLSHNIVKDEELPFALRRRHAGLQQLLAPLAPHVWRARKLWRKLTQ